MANDSTDNVTGFPYRTDIESEACDWIARIDGDSFSKEDGITFKEWLNSNPAHYETIKQLAETWGELNVLTCLSSHQSKPREVRSYRFALAGMVMLACLLGLFMGFGLLDSQNGQGQVYHSTIGQQLTRELPDGSSVLLNTDSEIKVAYSDKMREIWLLKGEVHFEVAHDAGRPFIVHAGDNAVTALGTAFTVYMTPAALEVLVTEGVVEVSSNETETDGPVNPAQPLEHNAAKVKPLQKIEISTVSAHADFSDMLAETLTREQMAQRLSWQQGVLVFNGEPLEQVVNEVSRYSNVEIELTDPSIKDTRIGGYFRTDDTESILNALETSFNIRVRREENRIMLSAKQQESNYL